MPAPDLSQIKDWDTVDSTEWTRNDFIEAFATAVTNLVAGRHRRPDLVGLGHEALIEAVDKWPAYALYGRTDPHNLYMLWGFIRATVEGDLLDEKKKSGIRSTLSPESKAKKKKFIEAASLDVPVINADGEEGEPRHALLPAENTAPSDTALDVLRILDTLTPLEQLALFSAYGHGDTHPRRLAGVLNVSNLQAQQLRAEAEYRLIHSLRNALVEFADHVAIPEPSQRAQRPLNTAQGRRVKQDLELLRAHHDLLAAFISDLMRGRVTAQNRWAA